MRGCDYVFHIGSTTGGANTYGVTADVVCPPGTEIHIGVWALGAAHNVGNRLCTIEVPAQNGLAGPHVTTDTVNDDLNIKGTFTNIHATRHGICLLDGTGTTTLNGETHIDVTVKGTNALGAPTGVTVTD